MRAPGVLTRGLSALAAVGLATAALTVATPAHAGTAGAELGIVRVHQGTLRHWYLTCEPDGGSHPTPQEACDRLRDINGDLDQLGFQPDVPCPRIYDPVQVQIVGRWHGEIKVFHEKYPNRCYAERLAGPVVPA